MVATWINLGLRKGLLTLQSKAAAAALTGVLPGNGVHTAAAVIAVFTSSKGVFPWQGSVFFWLWHSGVTACHIYHGSSAAVSKWSADSVIYGASCRVVPAAPVTVQTCDLLVNDDVWDRPVEYLKGDLSLYKSARDALS